MKKGLFLVEKIDPTWLRIIAEEDQYFPDTYFDFIDNMPRRMLSNEFSASQLKLMFTTYTDIFT